MEHLHLLIYVNNICDKGCPKCYYPHGNFEMPQDIQEHIPIWVGDLLREKNVKFYRIQFLGGEPLNSFDIVKRLYHSINEKKPEIAKPSPDTGWLIFTNGDKFTDQNLSELHDMKIKVQYNPNTDPLDVVDSKLSHIESICHRSGLAVFLNEVNLPRLPELTKLSIKHRAHMRVNRLYDGGLIPGYVEEYKKQMKKMFELYIESGIRWWPNHIMESSFPLWEGPQNCYSCGKWFLTIDPDGTLRSCNSDLSTVMGHIKTHKWDDLKFHQRWSAKNLPECQGCEFMLHCQGGCPFTRKLAYGTYNRKSPFCEAFKELFPLLYKLRDRWNETKIC
jgi:radical SAM protein with 4Fe4S-binding SPASM domain